ncbi:hypothetical protein HY490_03745 [Candidatus Woesearchaeota archaeon]|nr:hypothetical protein [Candidatus Woesearchaeota archaeon]
MTTSLLELRKAMNRARPKFQRTHAKALKRLGTSWRRPTGLHNKLRHKVFGRPISVTIGYRNPAQARGLDRNGLVPVRIHRPQDVTYLDPKRHSAIIGHVGNKNKLAILATLKAKGVRVLNFKDPEHTAKTIQESYNQRVAQAKAQRQQRRTAAKEREIIKAKTAKTETKTNAESVTTNESQKVEAKKELDKVLTQKQE